MKHNHTTISILHVLLLSVLASGCDGEDGGKPPSHSDDDTQDTDTTNSTGTHNGEVDEDNDGIPASEDCDDTDPVLKSVDDDMDCDGVLTADDCDDTDATMPVDDADCDGAITVQDCDDTDPSLNNLDEDGDGSSTCNGDCDDTDPTVSPDQADPPLQDRNCDGVFGTEHALSASDWFFGSEYDRDKSAEGIGETFASAGDVDGDGIVDVLVGSPGAVFTYRAVPAAANCLTYDCGAVALFLGGGMLDRGEFGMYNAHYLFLGEKNNQRVGQGLATTGDVDGDGRADILLAGDHCRLFLSKSLGSVTNIMASDADFTFAEGDRVASGDVNGDGIPDILCANTEYNDSEGVVYLYFGDGLREGIDPTPDYTIVGYNPCDTLDCEFSSIKPELGRSMSVGDVDGDGKEDLLLSASGSESGMGYVYLINAATLQRERTLQVNEVADYTFVGRNDTHTFTGRDVSIEGDIDGDGLNDILISTPYDNRSNYDAGAVSLMYARNLGAQRTISIEDMDQTFLGEGYDDSAGYAMDVLDADGDGLDDILIGAPDNTYSHNPETPGQTYLLLAANLGTASTMSLADADHRFFGATLEDRSGSNVARAGDLNGDGREDIMIASPMYYTSRYGEAYLIINGL